MSGTAPSPRRAAALAWMLAACGLALDIVAWWPGFMSFDAAYTWWQARGNTTTDITPPVFVWLWRLTGTVVEGPAGPFLLHLCLFWAGLALLVNAFALRAPVALVVMLPVAFTPLPWLMRAHAWTDVGLYCALVFAAAALARADASRRPRWLLLALPALAYAGLVRHIALLAVAPFAIAIAWLVLRDVRMAATARFAALAGIAAGQLAALAAAGWLLAAQVDRRAPLWPMIAQYDLAAVSIATGRILLPDFMQLRPLEIAELTRMFEIWSLTAMLARSDGSLRNPIASVYTPAELAALRRTWIDTIRTEPASWAAHRWRYTRALFGTHPGGWPYELVFIDAQIPYRDNPVVAGNRTALHAALMAGARRLLGTPALAAWPYLLVGLAAVPLAWRRRHDAAGRWAACLLASAGLYALPYVFVGVSAELRYLAWPCVASLLAFGMLVVAPQRG